MVVPVERNLLRGQAAKLDFRSMSTSSTCQRPEPKQLRPTVVDGYEAKLPLGLLPQLFQLAATSFSMGCGLSLSKIFA